MTFKNSVYFQSMHQTAAEYERKNSIKSSLTDGQAKACRAWRNSTLSGNEILEVRDLPWDREVHDFVETLRAAGIDDFAVTDQSISLIGSLHRLADEGCTMQGLCTVTKRERRGNFERNEECEEILFRI